MYTLSIWYYNYDTCFLLLFLLSLSFSHEGQVRHYHVKEDEEKKYYISEKHRFSTITELIEYHKLNGGGTCNTHTH